MARTPALATVRFPASSWLDTAESTTHHDTSKGSKLHAEEMTSADAQLFPWSPHEAAQLFLIRKRSPLLDCLKPIIARA